MDTLLEKITLYDFIGYTIPGGVFLGILVAEIRPVFLGKMLKDYEGYALYLFLVFWVLSYVCGICLSEISRFFFDRIQALLVKKKWKQDGIEVGLLRAALRNSGLALENEEEAELVKENMAVMYSSIQSDAQYKRIHNYASAEVMYKNMSFVLLVGAIISFFCFWLCGGSVIWCLIYLATAVIFGIRWSRFAKKKWKYTIYWFQEKYRPNQSSEE